MFGEIIPQSACSRHALWIGARAVPIVYFFLAVCFVIAWPISKCLDWILGVEVSGTYSRAELMEIVKINMDRELKLQAEELGILQGALKFSETRAESCMTPLDATFHLDDTSVLDRNLIIEILHRGHSRCVRVTYHTQVCITNSPLSPPFV